MWVWQIAESLGAGTGPPAPSERSTANIGSPAASQTGSTVWGYFVRVTLHLELTPFAYQHGYIFSASGR
jgi:hypothetical protein